MEPPLRIILWPHRMFVKVIVKVTVKVLLVLLVCVK